MKKREFLKNINIGDNCPHCGNTIMFMLTDCLVDLNTVRSYCPNCHSPFLAPRTSIFVNPPPNGNHCEFCNRHVSKLKTYWKREDFVNQDIEQAILVKNARHPFPTLNKEELDEIEKTYGIYERFLYEQAMRTIDYSWECADCFHKTTDDYFDSLFHQLKNQSKVKNFQDDK